jgi:integrase/recombinase XerD
VSSDLAPIDHFGALEQVSSDVELVRRFIDRFRSPNTQSGYSADIREFLRFVAKPLRTVTFGDLQDFASTLGPDVVSPATAHRRLSAIKSLITFGHRLGYLVFDVGAPLLLPKLKDNLATRIMGEGDLQHMLACTTDPRNAALLRLIYGAGLRVSEACGLCWRDCTPRDEGGQITVFGKGGRTRNVLLPAGLWERIYGLRDNADDDDPVFAGSNGRALDRVRVHRIVKAAAKRAGLSPRISAHWLRHAHVSHALDRGAPIHVVRETVGHASLETTTRYSHARPGDSSARYLIA